jgi:hypothetical protein
MRFYYSFPETPRRVTRTVSVVRCFHSVVLLRCCKERYYRRTLFEKKGCAREKKKQCRGDACCLCMHMVQLRASGSTLLYEEGQENPKSL